MERFQIVMYANFTLVTGLCILYGFAKSNTLFDSRQRKLFLGAILSAILVLACISADYILAGIGKYAAVSVRRFTSFVNFAASPMIPILLLALFSEKKRKVLYYVPAAVSGLCCFVSMHYPVVFYISNVNGYSRGPLFILPFAVTLFYMLLLLIDPAAKQKRARKLEQRFLILIIALMCVAMCVELVFRMVFLMWTIAGMGLILYYLLLNIHFFTMDSLTGCHNRFAYNRVLTDLQGRKNCMITAMDINGLKETNDSLGHGEGDRLLQNFAALLTEHTEACSDLYRIGGDEFVLLTETERLSHYRAGMNQVLEEARKREISFAYGEAMYEPQMRIEDVTALADERMYKMKKAMKDKKE